jgi:light-regulated signal transduction histidine kinase (bacteriophytochrome)
MLTREFNNMLEQIEKRDNELEQRVKERTEELEILNKELESFSYSVSHDMRAPVRAISGYARILSTRYNDKLDELGKEALTTVDSEARRMGQLIDDLLAFSRLGKKDVEKQNINMKDVAEEAVAEVLKSTEMKNKPEINIENMKQARCDKNLMRQVFINLISNAVKYSQRSPKPVVNIGYSNGAYFVKDNGVGFDMQYYNKLFGVFQRLHTEEEFRGTGIGLAIVHKIITKHGGNVWAVSEVGKGATFYFSVDQERQACHQRPSCRSA